MISDSIGTWPLRRAVKSSDHPALEFRDTAMSYAELAERVDRLAAAFHARGVRFGDRVAYLGNNHPSFVETLFATTLLGAIFVPLNTRLSVPELEYMLEDSGAMLLVSGSALEPRASAASAGHPLMRIVVDDPEPGDPVTVAPDADDYEQTIRDAPDSPRESAAVRLEDRALIIYTSGTTGRPKGAVLTHGNLTWNALNVLVDYDITSADRSLMISPLFHVAALGMGCLPVILKGATLLLEERFVPGDALRSIERLGATAISGVPTTFQLMLDDPAWATSDISSLHLLTCGGSAVPERVRAAYEARGLSFSGGYGMTEASPGITMLPPRYSIERAPSAGLAHYFTNFRIRAADEAGGSLAEPYERGEIEAHGPNVFVEYWGNDEATREAFVDDRWLRTGDIGYVDDVGFLYIVDRAKDMIISGGENIYSAEVEQAIATIPGVTGVAVIGVPHDRWGEVPHAVVTVASGHDLDPEEMVAHLSARMARYKVPKTLEIVDQLPRTASGKVQKQVLRERYDAQSSA
jgi:fatty-acyl-CoA synthase